MKKRLLLVIVLLAIVASPSVSASSAEMRVSVQVVAHTTLSVDSQPSGVEITPADVARGYVDVPEAIAFHVRSNARNGYSVQFQPVSAPFARAEVGWGMTSATVTNEPSWVAQPYRPGTNAGTMSVRLSLASGAAPGTYPWPVVVDADSL